MRKTIVIAVREYLAAVRTKAFILSLVIMPVLMSGSLLAQRLLRDFRDVKDKHFAVIDRSPGGQLFPVLEQAMKLYNSHAIFENDKKQIKDDDKKQIKPRFVLESVKLPDQTEQTIASLRESLSERVRKNELFGFLEIGPDILQATAPGEAKDENHSIRYQTNHPADQQYPNQFQRVINAGVKVLRALKAGAAPNSIPGILDDVPLDTKGLSRRIPGTDRVEDDSEESRMAPVLVPLVLMMLMFMVVLMSATPLMQGVVEEKMQRIAEVLLGSVRPFDLMLGKLLGMTAVSLTITAVYLSGAYWAAAHYHFAEYISASLLVWFFLFQALATLMYGSLFAAIGAACTDLKETQNLLWPVMLLITLPMFFLANILQDPNGPVATTMSFFPFATPTLMVARLAIPPGVPGWQPAVGIVLVLATTLVCVYAAGRIFRVGLLMQGKGARLGEMLRWVVSG